MRATAFQRIGLMVVVVVTLCGIGSAEAGDPPGDVRPAPADRVRPVALERPAHPLALRALSGCDQLREYIAEIVVEMMVQQRFGGGAYWLAEGGVWDAPGTSTGDDGPDNYTGTNNQEQGVDEMDRVKTDGEFVYAVEGEYLYLMDSWPPQSSRLAGSLHVPGSISGLLVWEDTAIVVSGGWPGEMLDWRWGGSRLDVVDISDRSAPRIVRTIEIEGRVTGARMIDGRVYVVVRSNLDAPADVWSIVWRDDLGLPELPADASDEERAAAMALARDILAPFVWDAVAGHELEELLPLLADRRQADAEPAVGLLVDCDRILRPAEVSALSLLSVVQIDLDTADPAAAPLSVESLVADGWIVYASPYNLYVAQSSWSWWSWSAGERTTAIHKFVLGGEPPVEYAATGEVEGWLLNQFSLSEHNGYLRVATTEDDWWWGTENDSRQPGSLVTVVADGGDGALSEVGQVGGIAPGERIYAVRFLGDRGFVVTFEQIDPLFTLDLADPLNPRVVGEIEVPGFSTYLHPLGEDHLIGVGLAPNALGEMRDLAVKIFDVSNLAAPVLEHSHVMAGVDGWSWSDALHDHHAFTFDGGVLSLPAYQWTTAGSYSGLFVLSVDPEDGIDELGRVDHADLPGLSASWMRRSLYIEDCLYSVSSRGMKVNGLFDPAVLLAKVPFSGDPPGG